MSSPRYLTLTVPVSARLARLLKDEADARNLSPAQVAAGQLHRAFTLEDAAEQVTRRGFGVGLGAAVGMLLGDALAEGRVSPQNRRGRRAA